MTALHETGPGPPAAIRPDQVWACNGTTITIRLVMTDAVSGVDEQGWQRTLGIDELRREWLFQCVDGGRLRARRTAGPPGTLGL